jgi:predicted nucleotidyltransferase
MPSARAEKFLKSFLQWAQSQNDILGVALVGSEARNTSTAESDVDLVVISSKADHYLQDRSWIHLFGKVQRQQAEDYGKLISLRAWYEDGPEVELGITDESWAAMPLDEGTRQVISEEMVVLFERGDILSRHKSIR